MRGLTNNPRAAAATGCVGGVPESGQQSRASAARAAVLTCAAAGLIAAVACASPAAQGAAAPEQPGTYVGKTSQGKTVTFNVSTDGSRISDFTVILRRRCRGGTLIRVQTRTIASLRVRASGRFTHGSRHSRRLLQGTFTGAGSASGTVRDRTPVRNARGRAVHCTTKTTWSATRQAPTPLPAPAPHALASTHPHAGAQPPAGLPDHRARRQHRHGRSHQIRDHDHGPHAGDRSRRRPISYSWSASNGTITSAGLTGVWQRVVSGGSPVHPKTVTGQTCNTSGGHAKPGTEIVPARDPEGRRRTTAYVKPCFTHLQVRRSTTPRPRAASRRSTKRR